MHIGSKTAHRIDPHFLQPVMFGGEVGIDLGMSRNPPTVLAQHIVAEQILRMPRRTRAHRDQKQVRPFGNRLG